MSKFRVEIQITVLAIIIGLAVVTIGYFSYKSLLRIVYSIQQGIQPNDKLFIIKEIASDLTSFEQAVRFYELTGNKDDLEASYSFEEQIAQNFKTLQKLNTVDKNDEAIIDSLSKLSNAKIDLWNEYLNMQLSSKNNFPAYTEIYSNVDKTKPDTTKSVVGQNETVGKKTVGDTIKSDTIQSETNPELKTGLMVGQNDTVGKIRVGDTIKTETIQPEISPELKTVRRKLLTLEWEIYKSKKKRNVQESEYIEKNILIDEKINELIKEAEIREANSLLEKTKEVNRLAEITYERLALYSISAVFLLFVALLVLFNYLRKARAIQRALTTAREEAEELALAKEQFAANVSHELRTPLNAIYGLTEQVLQKKLDNDISQMVSAIFKSADHLKNIVNDTLDFSKIQANKLILDSVHFSLAEIFDEVISLVKHEAENKGIALHFDWVGEKPVILIGDPLRLKQILINLIGNAIKFTEKGEVSIKVKIAKSGTRDFDIEILVIDTGIGIDENDLRFVFDEYVKIENQPGKKYSGTGLGLSIVKKLVELQGGKIILESKSGKGTTVSVNIRFPEGDPEKIEHTVKEGFEIPELFKQISVLIADDEEFNLFLLKNILMKWGVRFKEAKTGIEVFSYTRDEYFDLILMDLNMPEMNGIDAAKAILKSNPDIKIIAVTAARDEVDKQACLKAGMKGFLIKPFSEKNLFEMINSVFNGKFNSGQSARSMPAVNISELKRLSGGDEKFLIEMIQLFIKSVETGITEIEDGIKNENWNEILEKSHKMASPVKHIGATQLYEKIKLLEKLAQQKVPFQSIAQVFQEIKKEIKEIITILKEVD